MRNYFIRLNKIYSIRQHFESGKLIFLPFGSIQELTYGSIETIKMKNQLLRQIQTIIKQKYND